jgi:hypothetical protein
VNRQSNLKLTRFKLIKTWQAEYVWPQVKYVRVCPDMSSLSSDMSELGQICPVWGWICPIKLDLAQQKSRSGGKMMNLRPDKLTTYKLSTKKLRENKRTTRSNLNTRNHTRVTSNSKQEQSWARTISKSKWASTIDTRFIPEVWPTTKVAYVSVKELTKSRVSSTIILSERSLRSSSVLH